MDLKYQALAEHLLREVRAGRWPVGSKMPTERELVATTGHSLTTVRRAYDLLVEAGVVERRAGAGTFVTAPHPQPRPHRQLRVGVVVPDLHRYYGAVLQGIERELSRAHVQLRLATYNYDPALESEALDRLVEGGLDGLLLTPSPGHPLPERGIPMVLVERESPDHSGVSSDHAAGAGIAVAHLHGLGHRHVALLHRDQPITAPAVVRGFEAAIGRLGMEATRMALPEHPERVDLTAAADWFAASGASAALVFGDPEAVQLQSELRTRGIITPTDVSLVSYDDESAHLAEVPLTAVAPLKYRVGEAAAQLLLRQLGDGTLDVGATPASVEKLQVRPRLVQRESCAPHP